MTDDRPGYRPAKYLYPTAQNGRDLTLASRKVHPELAPLLGRFGSLAVISLFPRMTDL